MSKTIKKTKGGGKTFLQWWKNPQNRQKVYDSDKQDAEDLRKEQEQLEQNQKTNL